jgi:hypothetical protein
MQRETGLFTQFRQCFQMIDSINEYCKVKVPALNEALTELSFRWLIDLLYSGERTQAVGSLLFLSNLLQANRSLPFFSKYIIETFNGVFTLLNKISFKFTLSIQKRAHDFCKTVLSNFRESLQPEEKMPAFKRLTDFLVRLLPINKQQEQRMLVSLLNQLFTDSLSQAQLTEILCGEPKRVEDKINIKDMLTHEYGSGESVNGEKYSEHCPPLYVMLDYVVGLLKNYRTMITARRTSSSRLLAYEDCSTLTSVVLVASYIFKLKLNIELFERGTEGNVRFDPYVSDILETMLELIGENEHFNEKVMGGRGSSIRREERPTPNPTVRPDIENELGDPRANRPSNQNYRPNSDVYYQNFEYHIYIDDYDFQVQGWSILIESIVLFMSSFMVKQEVLQVIRHCRQQAQAMQQQGGPGPVNPPTAEHEAEFPVLVMRYSVIAKMFDLFSRLEHRIQEAVDKGFKQLLKVEPNEREIIPREQLECCFKPLLAFMQNQDPQERRNNLNENSMYCFMKLYQLFKSCFNPERLFEKFTEYLSNFEGTLARDAVPPKEEEMSQMNAIFGEIAIIASKPFLCRKSRRFH